MISLTGLENKILYYLVSDEIEDLKCFLVKNKYSLNFEQILEKLKLLISTFSMEALVAEYHLLKKDNKLVGMNLESRIENFKEVFNIEIFFKHYPELKRLLSISILDRIAFFKEILSFYEEDKISLNKISGCELGNIVDIDTSFGDLHDGKSVSIIEFDNGKWVYKPHSIQTDMYLNDILEYISQKNDLVMNTPKFLCRETYGWQEFVKYNECVNYNEVHNYYLRIGVYLGIFYILSSNDMHNENIIASGEFPFFFDTETIIAARTDGKSLDYKSIIESVLNTAVLPCYDHKSIYDVNFSAIFTDKVASREIEFVTLNNDPDLDFIYNKEKLLVESNDNTVRINGDEVKSEYVINDIILGFKKTLLNIIDNKTTFINILKQKKYENMKIRQLMRPTKVYAKFIAASFNPQSLSSSTKFEQLFDILINNFKLNNKFGYNRVDAEVCDLKMGYVPTFFAKYSSKHLYNEKGIVCEDYYYKTPLNQVIDKINYLDKNVINYQINLINLSMQTLKDDTDINNFQTSLINSNMVSNDKMNKAVKNYFNKIISNIIPIDTSESTFILLEHEEKSLTYRYGTPGLYNYGGLISFLAIYEFYYSKKQLTHSKKMLKSLMGQFISQNQVDKNNINYSVYEGFGSLIYLSHLFFKLTGEIEYLDFLFNIQEASLNSYLNKGIKAKDFDFIGGISGLIALIGNINVIQKNKDINKLLCKVGEQYLSKISNIPTGNLAIGLAHGCSGIIFALINLYQASKNENYLEEANRLMKYEDYMCTNKKIGYSWCKGIGGISIVRNHIINIIPSNFKTHYYSKKHFSLYNKDLILSYFDMGTPCLCHGTYGSYDILKTLAQCNSINLPTDIIRKYLYIDDLLTIKWFKSTNASLDSAMMGSSGLAYTMMREIYPEIPSFLSLQIF